MKKKISIFIKFIILAAIFYAILAFNVFHLGEKLIPSTKDYLNVNIPTGEQNLEEKYFEIDTNTQTAHGAATIETNLSIICDKINICDKLDFKGTFSTIEKYNYTKMIGKIVQFIDDNGTQDKNIKQVITDIKINKDEGSRRGYATRDSIVFNLGSVQSNKEFIELTTHEMGHIIDLGYIQGSGFKKDKNYTEFGKAVFAINDLSLSFYKISRDKETIRKAEAKKKNFCSGYGMSDPFEDFSECFNLYINHNIFFREIAKTDTILKKKYNFIAGIFNGNYISSNTKDLILIKNNTIRRPRDTTKLSN